MMVSPERLPLLQKKEYPTHRDGVSEVKSLHR
jgi:hypothetical protein